MSYSTAMEPPNPSNMLHLGPPEAHGSHSPLGAPCSPVKGAVLYVLLLKVQYFRCLPVKGTVLDSLRLKEEYSRFPPVKGPILPPVKRELLQMAFPHI